MRLAILSDVHGNWPALRATLADMRNHAFDQVVVLGDLACKGPCPEEAVRAIREAGFTVVQGNTDALYRPGAVRDGAPPGSPAAAFVQLHRWNEARLTEEERSYLANLPPAHRMREAGLLFVHATPEEQSRRVRPFASREEFEAAFAGAAERVIFCGHTHYPGLRWWEGRLVVNAGSVGQPYDGDNRACYVIYDAARGREGVTFRRVPYDVEETVRLALERGMPGALWYARGLREGHET